MSVPVSIRTSVVLPEPLGPMSPRSAPCGTVIETPSIATTSPKERNASFT